MHRAHVVEQFPYDSVAIYLTDTHDGRTIAVGEPAEITMIEVRPDGEHRSPTLRLSEDMARALLDALAAHFGGVSEVRTLRADYLEERKRVDKMIDHLTSRTPGCTATP